MLQEGVRGELIDTVTPHTTCENFTANIIAHIRRCVSNGEDVGERQSSKANSIKDVLWDNGGIVFIMLSMCEIYTIFIAIVFQY